MDKQKFLNGKINKKHIKYNSHDAVVSMLEGVIARGDRRVGQLLYEAFKQGSTFDAWSEHFNYKNWEKAFELSGVNPDFYTTRVRSYDEILPWDFIDTGVEKAYLQREYERSINEKVTPNCRAACSNCGLKVLGGGVCYEN
jgi:hypothetical protein